MSVSEKAIKAYRQEMRTEKNSIREQLHIYVNCIRKDIQARKEQFLRDKFFPEEELREGKYYCEGDYDEFDGYLWKWIKMTDILRWERHKEKWNNAFPRVTIIN